MTMKKTDLYKNLAKQIERQQKGTTTPERFGTGAKGVGKRDKKAGTTPRLVPLTCRLPAELVTQLRAHAMDTDGGVSAVVAMALEQWLGRAEAPGESATPA
ncbi:hypothetical protein G3580_13785 [Nitrogeniibacter mangrovi]|uniref:Uncharacterized protein n=1 Tax=Nitrogeniibacter mangrovi TaxID=2016596 RepID=A0A6C1B8D7_9RHOO|nr:hypothetical protein [Nitrogeniibacter mangrovi]QID18600.1 hypothetical protein G3580_13785 [Nitrogeniibacter mangrovi]